MKSILNNPYRILGLLAGTTARERTTKIRRLRTYLEAGQEPPTESDYVFPILGTLNRTMELVDEAASKLALDIDRRNAALFWFYTDDANSDKAAFDALANNKITDATAIWSKLTYLGKVTTDTCSAFQNLSTLLLCRSMQTKSGNAADFKEGLTLKLQFLESNCSKDFITKVTDATFEEGKDKHELAFLHALLRDVKNAKLRNVTPDTMVKALTPLNFEAKKDFMKEFVQVFVSDIEQEVNATEQQRKAKPEDAVTFGNNLFDKVADNLKKLKDIVGANDLKYTSTADMVAEEILQCAIDFHNNDMGKFASLVKLVEQKKNPTIDNAFNLLAEATPLLKQLKTATGKIKSTDTVQSLYQKAHDIATSISIKQKCKEGKEQIPSNQKLTEGYMNISTRVADNALGMVISEMNSVVGKVPDNVIKRKVNDALTVIEIIEKMDLVSDFKAHLIENKEALTSLKTQVEKPAIDPKVSGALEEISILLKTGNDLIEIIVEDVIANAKPQLRILKNALGSNNETYLQASTAIASKVLNACIVYINGARQTFNNDFVSLKYDVNLALGEIEKLEDMDLLSDFKNHLTDNKSALSDIRSQLYRVDISGKYDPYKINKKKEKAAKAYNAAKARREANREEALFAEKMRLQELEDAENDRQRKIKEAEDDRQRQIRDAEDDRQRQIRDAENDRQRQIREAEEERKRIVREAEKAKQLDKQVTELLNDREQNIDEADYLLKEAKPFLKTCKNRYSRDNYLHASSRIASAAIDMVNSDINKMLARQVINRKVDKKVIKKSVTGALKVVKQLNKMDVSQDVNAKRIKLIAVLKAFEERIGGQDTVILGIKVRGGALWAVIKYLLVITGIFCASIVLLESQWHAVSAPSGRIMKGLPYIFFIAWFFYAAYGVVSVVKQRLPAFGVFLAFIANVGFLSIFIDINMTMREITILPLIDEITVWALIFIILFYALFRLAVLKAANPGDEMNSVMFRLKGTPGVMYFSYFFRSLIIPLIIVCTLSLGKFSSVNTVWSAIFWIYGFLWAYDNIRVMLVCNVRRLKYSKMSQFWLMQHSMLFLPEAALFLIWYFDWLPMPKWVSGTLIVYGFFWLLASIGLLMAKNDKK
jgi:vacuolar-type H+-ATPase subunit H